MDDVAERLLQTFDGLLDIDVPVSLEPIYNEHSDRSCLCTPLSVCVSGGKTQLAERLLLCGSVNVDRPLSFDPFGPAPAAPSLSPRKIPLLLLACVCGQVDMLRTLLQRGCDLLALDHDGSTCLHYIARAKGNNAEMVRELQQHPGSGPHAPPWQSALLNLQNSAGDSWLHVACDHKQTAMCELLLPLEGCEVNLANPRSGCVALHVAVKKRCLPLVRLLLDSGADPTVKDTAEQDSLDLCRKMRPDSELYLAVQAAHAQRCAWATMEEEEAEEEETAAASGQKAAADDAVDETTTTAAAAAEASTAAATDILAISSSPSHCASASDSGDSSNVVFAQLAQLYDDAAAGLPDQSTGSAAAAAVGELHCAPGPTPAPAASSSLLPEGGGGGGSLLSRGRPQPPDSAIAIAAAAAAVSSSYSRPVPPKQPGAIGSSTARLSRIQIAAGHSLGSGPGPGPGAGAASSVKSDTVSGAAVVDKASATLRSSAYVYSTPQKSREQVDSSSSPFPVIFSPSPSHSLAAKP